MFPKASIIFFSALLRTSAYYSAVSPVLLHWSSYYVHVRVSWNKTCKANLSFRKTCKPFFRSEVSSVWNCSQYDVSRWSPNTVS